MRYNNFLILFALMLPLLTWATELPENALASQKGSSVVPNEQQSNAATPQKSSGTGSRSTNETVADKSDNASTSMEITIFYPFGKSNFNTSYLSNSSSVRTIDSLMNLGRTHAIDSFRIIGHASPDGNAQYNRRLSAGRAESIKEYLLKKYPNLITRERIVTHAGGENWEGLRRMVENDKTLPMKKQVRSILSDQKLSNSQRKGRLEQLDNGNIYRNYLLPRYYRYLRNGSSLLIPCGPTLPILTTQKGAGNGSANEMKTGERIEGIGIEIGTTPNTGQTPPTVMEKNDSPKNDSIGHSSPIYTPTTPKPIVRYDTSYVRPVALKTNLLSDIASAINIEIEVPLAPRWSIAAEWTFPWWLWEKNQHAFQLLQGSLEARYWIHPNSRKQEPRLNKHNPLTGWFVGVYGNAGYYDFEQNRKGLQGDLYGVGISAGYVLPLARNINMEFSLGVGYLETNFWNYESKQNIYNEWNLIRSYPGRIRTLALPVKNEESGLWLLPYKAKVSFVWYPHFKSVKKRGGTK